MSRSWKTTWAPSSKSLLFRDDERRALLVISWVVKNPLRSVKMAAWRPQKKHTCWDEEAVALWDAFVDTSDQRLVPSGEDVLENCHQVDTLASSQAVACILVASLQVVDHDERLEADHEKALWEKCGHDDPVA